MDKRIEDLLVNGSNDGLNGDVLEKQLTDDRKFFLGYNPTEDFTILIRAEDKLDAYRIADGYGKDSEFGDGWEITEADDGLDVLQRYPDDNGDCDYLVQDAEYDDELGDVIYL